MVTYRDLEVQPFINASGTITTLGGSLMPDEVLDAMREASKSFVDLNVLNVEAGDYLARRIGVPGAFVSCGAASGVQLSAAACLTGPDPASVLSLPHTEGWRDEFVISSVDPHTYIHQGIEVCGGKLVFVGDEKGATDDDILGAIGEKTAAVVHFLGKQSREQLERIVSGADETGVPVMVDAAAQLPPRSNLVEIVGIGASLVTFSGGKGLRGPQNSGLVLGKSDYIDAVRMNASPNSAIGRGMKVGKEEILGLLTAVDLFLRGKDEEDRTTWEWQASSIVKALDGVEGVNAFVQREGQSGSPDFAPRAYIEIEESRVGDVVQSLRQGTPSIVIRGAGQFLCVDPMTLVSGEEDVVGQRLREVLSS